MICISLSHISQIEKINVLKPDMVELRLDLIREDPMLIMDRLDDGPKVIATCRPGNISDVERLDLLKALMDTKIAYIDIEIDSDPAYCKELIEYARGKHTEVIVSWHDFEKTVTSLELLEIMSDCYEMGADIAKIASMVNSVEDNARLLALYNVPGRKVILGMGDLGKITRVAALKLGAEFTFASLDEGKETAPGQLTIDEFDTMNKILKSS